MDEVELMQELETWPGRRLRLGGDLYEVCAIGTPPYIGGGEGLVEPLRHQQSGAMYMLKCFYQPTDERRRRAKIACELGLARGGAADVLAGAPLTLIDSQLGKGVPFAVVSKWCDGEDWRKFRNKANERRDGHCAPPDWPSLKTRLLWAYGLTRAIALLEEKGVVHVDISPGNVMVSERPDGAHISLIDFDGYCAPGLGVTKSLVQGAPSYAAREIRQGKPELGSDRVGMALIVQEFLVSGHPLFGSGSFEAGYSADDLERGYVKSLPFFKSHFKPLSELFDKTLQVTTPGDRPTPAIWSECLKEIFKTAILEPEVKRTANLVPQTLEPTKKFAGVVVKAVDPPKWWDFADNECVFDLEEKASIGGVLRRDTNMKIILTAKNGRRIGFEWRPAEFLYLPEANEVVIDGPGKIQDLDNGKHVELDGVVLMRPAA
jgi:serine/threonine protein kinase